MRPIAAVRVSAVNVYLAAIAAVHGRTVTLRPRAAAVIGEPAGLAGPSAGLDVQPTSGTCRCETSSLTSAVSECELVLWAHTGCTSSSEADQQERGASGAPENKCAEQ